MINYNTIANTVGNFPDVVAQNATGPGATDGTPYIKAVVDDLWGARQALLNHVVITPNGIAESAGTAGITQNSQQLDAIQKISGAPGEIVIWAGDEPNPQLLNIRVLRLTGQGVLRTLYPDLDDVTYVGDTDNPTAAAFYHADDAGGLTRNTTGNYLILPDLRGVFLRGYDPTGEWDPDADTRWIGGIQEDAILNHEHIVLSDFNPAAPYLGFGYVTNQISDTDFISDYGIIGAQDIYAQDITPETGDPINVNNLENRPVNSAFHMCIRY